MRKLMIRIFGALILAINFFPLTGQNLDGTYVCGEQKIKIIGDKIEYELISFSCCIQISYNGNGRFELQNNRLFIEPLGILPPKLSTIERFNSDNKDTMTVLISGDEPSKIIVRFFSKNKNIYGIISDSNGQCLIPRLKINNCDSIHVGLIGYKPVGCKINMEENNNYKVRLYPDEDDDFHYEFITNEGEGFKIKIKPDRISLKYNKRLKHHRNKPKTKFHTFRKIA